MKRGILWSGYPCTCFDLCNIIFILSVLSLFFDHFHIFLISRITSFLFILFELFHLIIRDRDASALEKYYHRTCLRSSQRTFTPVLHSNVLVIRTVCDEQLLLSIQNTHSDGVTLNMGEMNDAYLIILKRYHLEVDDTTNYRKHLKQLNTDYLQNAQFVKSFRKK